MKRKIKVVQIGVEHDHGPDTMKTMRRLTDDFEVLGYAVPDDDPNDNPIRNTVPFEGLRRYTVEEALSLTGVEAVTIECADEHLTKYALMAAKRGLAVHIDKPGGCDHEEFAELIKIAKEKHIVLQTGYMYRYNPAVEQILKDIDAGKLGQVLCVEAQMNCLHSTEKRNWLAKYPSGQLFFLGCHMIDLIYRIMGEPEEVLSLSKATAVDGAKGTDNGFAVFRYPTGASFAKSCCIEPGGFMRRQLFVSGSRGSVQLMPFETPCGENSLQYTTVREVFDHPDDWGNNGRCYQTAPFGRYDRMMQAFAAYVRGEEANPYTPDYELGLHDLLLQACGAK